MLHLDPQVVAGKGAKGGAAAKGKLPKRSKEEQELLRVKAAVEEHRIANSDSVLLKSLAPLSAVPQRIDVDEEAVPASLDKAIVFSQWTSMLDQLEEPLRRAGEPGLICAGQPQSE